MRILWPLLASMLVLAGCASASVAAAPPGGMGGVTSAAHTVIVVVTATPLPPTATATPDVAATVQARVVATIAAIPTATVPPTVAPTATPLPPTATPSPAATLKPTISISKAGPTSFHVVAAGFLPNESLTEDLSASAGTCRLKDGAQCQWHFVADSAGRFDHMADFAGLPGGKYWYSIHGDRSARFAPTTPIVVTGPTATPTPMVRSVVPVPTTSADPGLNAQAAVGLVCRWSPALCSWGQNVQFVNTPAGVLGEVTGSALAALFDTPKEHPLYVAAQFQHGRVDQLASVIAHEATHIQDSADHPVKQLFEPTSYCYMTEGDALTNQALFWAWLYSAGSDGKHEYYPSRDALDRDLFRLTELAAADGWKVNPVAYSVAYQRECQPNG